MSSSKASYNPTEGVAVHPRLPPALTSEMSRLFSAGFSLVPLGGEDGKKPTMSFRDRKRFPLSIVVDRMGGSGSKSYGVRLNGLLVVDVDTDTPEARAYVEDHFGASPARTRTGRGFHLWFRYRGKKPRAVRSPGISIDFKSGKNEFVVGPQSERPDRVIYCPEGRLTTVPDLPWFENRDGAAGAPNFESASGRIPVGSRNDALKRRARQLAHVAADCDSLLADLLAFRDSEMEHPHSCPHVQVAGLANWAWQLRMQGNLWGGANSVVVIKRSTVEEMAAAGHHIAMALFLFLKGRHGGESDAVFAINPRALRKEGYFRDGVGQLYAAIKVLVAFGHLVLVRPARGKRNHHEYRLGDGVVREGNEGKRASSYISIQIEDPKDPDVEAA